MRDSWPLAFLLTWTTFGTWLHGDERGSMDRHSRGLPSEGVAESAPRNGIYFLEPGRFGSAVQRAGAPGGRRSVARMEHFGQQEAVGAFAAIDQVLFEGRTLDRRKRMFEIALRDCMPVDIGVIHQAREPAT